MEVLQQDCKLEHPQETIAIYRDCDVKFQRSPYTKGAILLIPSERRSTFEVTDLETMVQFAQQHPERIVWCSPVGAGATQVHIHFQSHRRAELGGKLPIELSGRTELLSIPATSVRVARLEGYSLPGLIVTFENEDDRGCAVQVAAACLGELHHPANIIVSRQALWLIGRSKEIPEGWGNKKFGSAEIAGVLITQAPLAHLTFATMQIALTDVGLSPAQQQAWEARILHRLARPSAEQPLTRCRIRLVVLDIEGVLLPAGANEPWDWQCLGKLRCLLERLPFAGVLCSGRSVAFGEALINNLNLRRPLPKTQARRLAAYFGCTLRGWPSIFENGALFFDPLERMAIIHPHLAANIERRKAFDDVRVIVEALRQARGATLEPGKTWCLSLNPPYGVDIKTFAAEVKAQFATYEQQGYITITASFSAVDITPQGISKAAAVAFFLDAAGLASAEILGVGDSEADRDWLELVGICATPANGDAALEPLCPYRSPYPTIAGTLDILRRLA